MLTLKKKKKKELCSHNDLKKKAVLWYAMQCEEEKKSLLPHSITNIEWQRLIEVRCHGGRQSQSMS